MVMRLDVPPFCSVSFVDSIVEERQHGKNAKYFRDLKAEWRDRVQCYIDAGGAADIVPTWPAIEEKKETFTNLYKSPSEGSIQKEMLSALRDHGLTICPACGEPGTPNTLDHYLPKGKYPHFSVTPHNLFPMCDICQGHKGEKTGDKENPRFFLHPYFDVFVKDQVIKLSINPPYRTPTFDLAAVSGLSGEESSLVNSHIRELGIVSRYGPYFREQYQRLLKQVKELRDAGLDVELIVGLFFGALVKKNMNSWDQIFHSSVVNNPELLEFMKNGELPDNV